MGLYIRYLAWLALVVGGLALTGTVMPFAAAAKATTFLILVAVTILGAWHLFPAVVSGAHAGRAIGAAILIVLAFGYWDDMAPYAAKIGISRNLLRSSAYDHALAHVEGEQYETAQEYGVKCLEQAMDKARARTNNHITGAMLANIKMACDAKVREYTPPPMDNKSRSGGYDPQLDVSYVEPARSRAVQSARESPPAIIITDDTAVAVAAPAASVTRVAEANPELERTLRELDRKAVACTSVQCVREIESQFDSTRKEYRKTQTASENSSFDSWLAFAPDRFADHRARGQLHDELTQTTAALRICNPRDQDCKELAIKRAALASAVDATPTY